ncbi:cupin domain-containing protein [Candidatus Woesearchaeota archaeon]|nr:cupin domain-containing protein [Candidatus Woesearchaeota archaeon]
MIIKEKDVKPIMDVCGELKEIYYSKNLSISIITFPPGSAAKKHFHNKMEEVYYVISGKGKIGLGNKTLKITAGDTIPIPKKVFHAATNPYSKKMKLLIITHPKFSQQDVTSSPH